MSEGKTGHQYLNYLHHSHARETPTETGTSNYAQDYICLKMKDNL